MKTSILIISLAFLTIVAESEAKVRAASLITDNMVLPQNSNARIYGTADPGADITIIPSWNNKAYTTSTDRTGEWSLAIETPAGGFTPYSITISDGEPLTVNNVLIGEVWLASGQSNMQMPLKGFPGCCTLGGYDEIASSGDEAGNVRFFTVPLTQSYTPLDTVAASWTVPSPGNSSRLQRARMAFRKTDRQTC